LIFTFNNLSIFTRAYIQEIKNSNLHHSNPEMLDIPVYLTYRDWKRLSIDSENKWLFIHLLSRMLIDKFKFSLYLTKGLT
jgi:hypothetical protein